MRYPNLTYAAAVILVAFVFLVGLPGPSQSPYAALTEPQENDDLSDIRRRTVVDDGSSSSSSFELNQLVEKFRTARAQFMTKLEEDYGSDNVAKMFQAKNNQPMSAAGGGGRKQSIARLIFVGYAHAWERMRNKVAMKILQAQIEEKAQPFVWATGGHSAAAGHGNLFNESYTAVMEMGGMPLFEAVGLKFSARRYAMGGTSCGMEINTCIKEVFGNDIDILSWDYGMTTAGRHQHGFVELYFHRAALLPSRPAIVAINMNSLWKQILKTIPNLGPAVFSMEASAVERAVPDSIGKTTAELEQMPPNVRAFKCGSGSSSKALEKGGDACVKAKYTVLPNDDPCNQRKGKVSWHPGWKWHALYGNLLILFWIEIIGDALQEIHSQGSDPMVLFQTLKRQQEDDFSNLHNNNHNKDAAIQYVDKDLDQISDIPNEVIYWNPNYCHTARIPSEIRYRGILTESEQQGRYKHYDPGYRLSDVRSRHNEQMPLTWDPEQYQTSCRNYVVEVDHMDFFTVNAFGWSTLTLPNPTEQAVYGSDSSSLLGFISVCLASCGWNCPPDVLGNDELRNPDKFSMTVNDVSVTGYSDFGSGSCLLLKHGDSHQWSANNNDGLYVIRAKVTDPAEHVRISAIVIW